MRISNVFISLVVLIGNAAGRKLSVEEYYQLPDLFHLDNYEKCLAYDGGVYCLGTFLITPLQEPHPVYQLMKEYSEETYAFNHTFIHRGYCISSRCPELNDTFTLHNTSHLALRFERCTSKIAAEQDLQANLTSLKYCRTRADTQRFEISNAQIAFFVVVLLLLTMNAIGTVYDITTRGDVKKKPILMAWSAVKNWKVLTSYVNKGPSALTGLHGIRVSVAIATCLSHSALLYYSLFLYNPRALENGTAHPLSMFLQNSTGSVQMFVVMSRFLHAYHLRGYAQKHDIGYRLLPLIIIRRIFRLGPVFFLVVGFAATWWPVLGDGPLWSATVGAESDICKENFWYNVFFINNLVQTEKHCVLPTWYMAVDLQMHILTAIIMLHLLKYSPRTIALVLCFLFAASCVLNAALVYTFDWIPMLYLTVSPENLRTLFHDVPSFSAMYLSPWGSFTACFLGLILGTIYYDMRGTDFNMGRYKWVLNLSWLLTIPLIAVFILLGYFLQHVKAKAFMVVYAALERFMIGILFLLSYVLATVLSGFMIKVLSWRGWHALSRMSLSVMMVHWLVNLYLVGSTPQPMSTSLTAIIIYGISTAVYTFIFAVPITILVEMPVSKSFDVISNLKLV